MWLSISRNILRMTKPLRYFIELGSYFNDFLYKQMEWLADRHSSCFYSLSLNFFLSLIINILYV